MKTKSFVLLLLGLLPTYLVAQYSLFGTVTDEEGTPLPAATVLLSPGERATSTDADGFFRFQLEEKGTYELLVSYLGFDKHQASYDIKGHQDIEVILRQRPQDLATVDIIGNWATSNTPMTFTNITQEEIEPINLGQDAPFLLRYSPSMVVNSDAGAGIGYTSLRLRGTDPTRINITINGIPLNDAESHGVFWVNLPDFLSDASVVQIQRGVGTSTNGAGAFGGTIGINTKTTPSEAGVSLHAGIGSFNTNRQRVQFSSGLIQDKFFLNGRLSRIHTDGFIDRAEVDLQALSLSGGAILGNHSIRANVFSGNEVTYQAWNGVPAQYIDQEELRTFNVSGTERPGTPHPNEVDDYGQDHYQLLYDWLNDRSLKLNAGVHYTRGKGFFEQYKANQLLANYGLELPDTASTDLIRRLWLDNHFYGLVTNLSFKASPNWSINLGGAWNHYVGEHYGRLHWMREAGNLEQDHQYYFAESDKYDFNFYFRQEYNFLDKLNAYLDLQYRRIDYQSQGTQAGLVFNSLQAVNFNKSFNFFNPKAGFQYRFGDWVSQYSIAVAHREPNRNDFVNAGSGPLPKAERLVDHEIGLVLSKKQWELGFNMYYMDYKDQLVQTGDVNNVGEATRVNVENSYRAGLEIYGSYQQNQWLEWSGGLTLSQNRIDQFEERIDNWSTGMQDSVTHENTDLAFSPQLIGQVQIKAFPLAGIDDRNLFVQLTHKYVGEQFLDNTSNSNTKLDAYLHADLAMGYNFLFSNETQLGVHLLIQNLWNQDYETFAWTYRYRSPGYDGRPDDPYTRLEDASTDTYNQTGFFPQASINYLLGLSWKF